MPMAWIYGLMGGLMIGLGGALFLLINGRIMGASGLIGDLIDGSAGRDWAEDLAFVAALVAAPGAVVWVMGGATTHATGNLLALIAAGLLVGFGTRLANGCTSGHGVCGMSRLAPRGIAASLAYVMAGMAAMAVLCHVWGVI